MSISTAWDSLTKSALLGTGRGGFNAPPLDEGLAGLAGTDESDEKRLLAIAGTLALMNRAGAEPVASGLPELPVCAAETAPYLSDGAANRFHLITASYKALLPEWLKAAGATGKIAPPQLLPELLDLGRGSRELRLVVLPLLGERGRWLAQLNPDWRKVAGVVEEDLQSTWELGAFPARLEALRETRAEEPAKAREWLASGWAQEDGRERAQFLELLDINLSQEDEPFLEAALDDKRAEVRDAARALLARLPESRFVQRMWALAKEYIGWRKVLLGGLKLDVKLPEGYQKEWKRDGIVEKVPAHERSLGERAYWLSQILENVPPTFWSREIGTEPKKLLAAAKGDWGVMLTLAWREAAIRSRDHDWSVYFLEDDLKQDTHFNARMLQVVGPESAESLVTPVIEDLVKKAVQMTNIHVSLLQTLPGPWSANLSRLVLRLIYKQIQRPEDVRQSYILYSLSELGNKLNPALAPELKEFWPEDHPNWPHWEHYIRSLENTLHFRHEMLLELQA
jgi:hypothetical protein